MAPWLVWPANLVRGAEPAIAGTLITWVGAMLGAVVAFGLARWFGRRFVEAVAPARYIGAIDEWTSRQGTGVLLVSRLLPVISFNLINYAAGLTRVSWWTFLWTTGLGITPLTFLMVFAGEQMMSGNRTLALSLMSAVFALARDCQEFCARGRLVIG